MQVHLKFYLLGLLLAAIWVGGGPVYCFSPGKVVKLENHFTGCQCPATCRQIEENTALSESTGRLPQLLPILPEAPRFRDRNLFIFPVAEKPVFPQAREKIDPLLYVKLLF